MPRNFRLQNARRYSSTVPNLSTIIASSPILPSALFVNYKNYTEGNTLNSRTAIGANIHIAIAAPKLLGAFPGGGLNTQGYPQTRIGSEVFNPEQTPQLTVLGTILSTPSNLTFSPWGGTGTLENAVNGKATRLLRPLFVKVV
jgi:hypothetical protein